MQLVHPNRCSIGKCPLVMSHAKLILDRQFCKHRHGMGPPTYPIMSNVSMRQSSYGMIKWAKDLFMPAKTTIPRISEANILYLH